MVRSAKIIAAILLAVLLVVFIDLFAALLYPPPAPPVAQQEQTPVAEEPPLGDLLTAADVDIGRKMARKCVSCHTFDVSGAHRAGPNLSGIVGAAKGAKAGFVYSDALLSVGGTWTYEDLNAFLTKPAAFLPGTRMSFPGVPNREERAALIAFLRSITENPPPLPRP